MGDVLVEFGYIVLRSASFLAGCLEFHIHRQAMAVLPLIGIVPSKSVKGFGKPLVARGTLYIASHLHITLVRCLR